MICPYCKKDKCYWTEFAHLNDTIKEILKIGSPIMCNDCYDRRENFVLNTIKEYV